MKISQVVAELEKITSFTNKDLELMFMCDDCCNDQKEAVAFTIKGPVSDLKCVVYLEMYCDEE